MTAEQWDSIDECPNCKISNPILHDDFVGMVSLIIPTSSWVARYNFGDMKNRIPGIYALSIPTGEEDDGENDEGDEGFVVGDDNIE